MAYPYYVNPYQTGYYQPYSIPAQQVQSSQTQNTTGIIWVSGESEAAMYPIAPNCAVALWSQDGKTVYLKKADPTGKPTMTVYDLVEQTSPEPSEPNQVIYATKDEIESVSVAIESIRTDIETMRGDLYGLAGKKRSVKKEDPDNDE